MRDWVRSEDKRIRSCDIVVQSLRIRQELRDPERPSACNRVCKTVKLFVLGFFLKVPLNCIMAAH
jgi:hypothetical protein